MSTVGAALIVIDGSVRGAWRRTLSPSLARMRLDFRTAVSREERREVEEAARRYGRFVERKVEID
jgi:hypothetical protein